MLYRMNRGFKVKGVLFRYSQLMVGARGGLSPQSGTGVDGEDHGRHTAIDNLLTIFAAPAVR
jgi:hypothetical protein